MTGLPYRKAIKPRFPRHWFDDHPHTHVALDDAIEQGALFCNMLADLRVQQAALAARAPAADTAADDGLAGQNPTDPRAN